MQMDQIQNITGTLIGTAYPGNSGYGNDWTGAFERKNQYWSSSNANNVKTVVMYNADFDASRVVRAGAETRPINFTVKVWKRIS